MRFGLFLKLSSFSFSSFVVGAKEKEKKKHLVSKTKKWRENTNFLLNSLVTRETYNCFPFFSFCFFQLETQIIKKISLSKKVKGLCALKNGCIATASRDKTIKIWSPVDDTNWENTTTLIGHTSFVGPVIQTGENELVSGGYDNCIIIWDLQTGEAKRKLEGHENAVVCLAVNQEGEIISGSWDK